MDDTETSGAASDGALMDTADWQARATHIRQVLAAAPNTAVAEALGTFLFSDDGGKTWTYNGAAWMSWDGSQWSEGSAPSTLRLQPFVTDEDAADTVAAAESAATADAAATTGTTEPASVSAAMPASSVDEEKPALADSRTIPDTVSPAERKPTELEADKAESVWGTPRTSPSASEPATTGLGARTDRPATELPAMSDAAKSADTATTADLAKPSSTSSQPTPASAWQPSTSAGQPTPPSAWQPGTTAGQTKPMSQPSTPLGQPSTPLGQPSTSPTQSPTSGSFRATHAVPAGGMGAWTRPDPSVRPEYQLAARTELMLVEMLASGWARVAGSNGWTGWVDGRQLVQLPSPGSSPMGQPMSQPQPASMSQPMPTSQPTGHPMSQPQPAPMSQPQTAPVSQPMQQPAQPPQAAYRPTHAVPPMGMPAWAQPNPALPPQAQLQPGLQLMVGEWTQSGWAKVVAANGWSGWVDGRMLVPMGQPPYQR